jgi:hypothetical protein
MRKIIAFVALVAATACSLDKLGTEPYAGSLAGTYTLKAMNGMPIPFTFVSADTTITIDSDVILMADDGNWSETVAYRKKVGSAAPTNEGFALAGTYTRTSPGLNFYLPPTAQAPDGVLIYQGQANETSMALADRNFTYLFQR